LKRLGREREVIPALEQYATIDRNNLSLKLLLGRELGRGGQTARAQALYQELARLVPTAEVYRGWFALEKESGERGLERILEQLDETLGRATDKEKPSAA